MLLSFREFPLPDIFQRRPPLWTMNHRRLFYLLRPTYNMIHTRRRRGQETCVTIISTPLWRITAFKVILSWNPVTLYRNEVNSQYYVLTFPSWVFRARTTSSVCAPGTTSSSLPPSSAVVLRGHRRSSCLFSSRALTHSPLIPLSLSHVARSGTD